MERAGVRRPNGKGGSPSRSVRVSDEVWESSRRRASYQGVTMSYVVQQILSGYAQGKITLPTVTVQYDRAFKE